MNIFLVCAVYFLAAATPGPSQFFILEKMIVASPREARCAALGVSVGTFIWVLLVTLGLSHLVAELPASRVFLAWLAVLLLVFFAARNLIAVSFARRREFNGSSSPEIPLENFAGSRRASFLQGMLVNLLNPNSIVFFMTLFAPLVTGRVSGRDLSLSVGGVMIISVAWYQLLAESWRFKRFYALLKSQAPRLRILITVFYIYWALKLIRDFDLIKI